MATAAQPRVSELGVLLIEADPLDASVLTRLLREQWGLVDVVHEERAAAAARHLEQDAVRVVIHSVSRGELDALRSVILQAKPRPVIALVQENESDLVRAAADAGVASVFVKERLLEAYAEQFVRVAAGHPQRPTAYSLKMRRPAAQFIG